MFCPASFNQTAGPESEPVFAIHKSACLYCTDFYTIKGPITEKLPLH